jgi:hypothetical protein
MTEETKLVIHSTTAKAALKFNIEAWVLKKRDDKKMEASQMKFLRHLRGIIELGRERNQSVRDKLVVWYLVGEIEQYQQNWLQHLHRMDRKRIPKQGAAILT